MDDDLDGQFARMGASVTIAGTVAPVQEAFEVMLANADAITAWLACETQWRLLSRPERNQWLGLDYPAVDTVLRRLQFADPDAVFRDLQVMEGAALDTFQEHT